MSKYKTGDKVVLEITDKVEVMGDPWYLLSNATSIYVPYLDKAAEPLTNYTKLLEAYINDLLLANERLSNEKKDCIEQARAEGQNEAWELARKIAVIPKEGGCTGRELFEIFNTATISKIFSLTYSEATTKVEAWEKTKAKEKPQKTILMDLLEKHPNIETEVDGLPKFCPFVLGYKVLCSSKSCKECWNTPLEQIEEE